MSHYVIVTGGREYDDWAEMGEILTFLSSFYGPELRVLHGGARGADSIAHTLCGNLGIKVKAYPADWKKNGVAAGHIRNAHMASLLEAWQRLGHSVQIVAVAGGTGTAGMCRESERRGIPVDLIPNPDWLKDQRSVSSAS